MNRQEKSQQDKTSVTTNFPPLEAGGTRHQGAGDRQQRKKGGRNGEKERATAHARAHEAEVSASRQQRSLGRGGASEFPRPEDPLQLAPPTSFYSWLRILGHAALGYSSKTTGFTKILRHGGVNFRGLVFGKIKGSE